MVDLHPILRIYVGCGEVKFGDLHNADVIKIHKNSGKLTLLFYDDFERQPLPELYTRIKINLRTQEMNVFDHKNFTPHQFLYFKERFVRDDYPGYEKWKKYGDKLRKFGFSEDMGFGPSKEEFLDFLAERGLTLHLVKKRSKVIS